jgi:glycosyltransferase involved in cell wall biosynthesis
MLDGKRDISIVMATYNGEKYLDKQLESIVNQTVKPAEIIICDDCSTDKTLDIIRCYQSKLPIHLELNEVNIGYVKNFEKALSLATGEYISFCDQDDIWEPEKLEILLGSMQDYSLVYSNSVLIDSEGKNLNKTLSEKIKTRFISTQSPLAFAYSNCVSAHAMMFHRFLISQIKSFPETIAFDAWIAANAATAMKGILYIDRNLVRYRQHTNNTVFKHIKNKTTLLEKLKRKAENKRRDHLNYSFIIADLLQISTLNQSDRKLLELLKDFHLSFEKRWFSLNLYKLLYKNRKMLFAMNTRNEKILSFKKSIGYRMYRQMPFI